MESWENKIIAEKLNSLRELPEGYSPNIASKWEIIQSGLSTKKDRSHRGWWLGFILLASISIALWFLSPEKEEKALTQLVNAPQTKAVTQNRKVVVTEKVSQETRRNTIPKNAKKPVAADETPNTFKRLPIQPMKIENERKLVDSVIRIRPDTVRFSFPTADIKTIKQKKKTYQKDFEGIASKVDSSAQKTASKGFQIQWRVTEEKGINTTQPRIRLMQNF